MAEVGTAVGASDFDSNHSATIIEMVGNGAVYAVSKLGQPQPEENFWSEVNSICPQAAQ